MLKTSNMKRNGSATLCKNNGMLVISHADKNGCDEFVINSRC